MMPAEFLPLKSLIALLSQGSPGSQTPRVPLRDFVWWWKLTGMAEPHKEDLDFLFFSSEAAEGPFP